MKIFSFKKYIDIYSITLFDRVFTIKHKTHYPTTYPKILKRLSHKKGKIKVGFLVTEQAKWQYQSIYEELAASDKFEPIVLVTMIHSARNSKRPNYYKTIDECFEFFKQKNLNTVYAYDVKRKKYISPKKFGIDILFFQQPWQTSKNQSLEAVCKYALPCYLSYGLHLDTFVTEGNLAFLQSLWAYFTENSKVLKLYRDLDYQKENIIPVGTPKLDVYFQYLNKTFQPNKKPLVIYAPHHSFEEGGLMCASFRENGKDILKFAQQTASQVDWIFKPHPRFKTAVIKNDIMTENEVNDYYKAWEDLGRIYDSGDYFDLFMQSDAMITDCISFLGEYLPTKHPLLHLIGPKYPMNSFFVEIADTYYKIHDENEFRQTFERVILHHDDYNKEKRIAKIPLLFDEKQKAAAHVVSYLEQQLKK